MHYEDEIFPTTRGVCAYVSAEGFLVIEQEGDDNQKSDQSILIHPRDIKLFMLALKNITKVK